MKKINFIRKSLFPISTILSSSLILIFAQSVWATAKCGEGKPTIGVKCQCNYLRYGTTRGEVYGGGCDFKEAGQDAISNCVSMASQAGGANARTLNCTEIIVNNET